MRYTVKTFKVHLEVCDVLHFRSAFMILLALLAYPWLSLSHFLFFAIAIMT